MALKFNEAGNQAILSLRNNLVTVIKQFAIAGQQKVVMDNLCLGLTYIIMHTH